MTPLVAVAVLAAAITHASWNAIAHAIRDQLLSFTLISGGGVVIGLVLACFAPLPAAGAWPYLLVSAALHVAYMVLLMRSFALGDFGQMYPIARGTAPLVVTVLAAVLLGERPDAWATAGVAVASAGLVGLALWGIRGSGERPRWPAILAALGTGLAIAGYTTVDGAGVRASGTPLGYVGWLMAVQGVVIPAYAYWRRRHELVTQLRPFVGRGLLGATLSVSAYGLVLWAQTKAPLAPIAALRESSIIVGAAIGTLFFKERFGAPRIAAAGLMVVGIGLMLHTS
ncbi:EamA family transporter [Streptomyces sp. NPDC102402]|uniref:EamA family transporter n=1 Tax=Streptomyces sp. NPDC102402 TaxID=3366169 RepID=UPI003804010C